MLPVQNIGPDGVDVVVRVGWDAENDEENSKEICELPHLQQNTINRPPG